jgi:ribosomal protein S4E
VSVSEFNQMIINRFAGENIMNDQKTSDCFASYAGFSVGEKVTYLVKSEVTKDGIEIGGKRLGMLATITNISRHLLSQNSFVFMLSFEDDTLPEALKTQPVTFPQNSGWFEKYTDF